MMLVSNGATYTHMNACNVTYNEARLDGGGLHVSGGATVLAHTTFANNIAAGRGGAVVYWQQSFVSGKPALHSCVSLNIFVLSICRC